MQAQFLESIAFWRRPVARNRKVSLVIVLLVEALIIVALLTLAGTPQVSRRKQSDLVALTIAAEKTASEKSRSRPLPQKKTAATPVKAAQPPLPTPPIPTPNMVVVSKEDFEASDISKLGKSSGGAAGGGAKSAYGPGDGPGGKTLYPAEWYVEPPRSALALYLPNGAPPGAWAMVACRTIERYHVDNCYTLGQSHPGLSSALRQAAWQFLVLPPRVDGRPLVGAWVRIRFEFTKKPDGADDDEPGRN